MAKTLNIKDNCLSDIINSDNIRIKTAKSNKKQNLMEQLVIIIKNQ